MTARVPTSSEAGARAGLRPAARRHHPQPARPAGGPRRPRAPRSPLTCGSARFTLLTLPVEDYPTLPAMPPAAGTVGSDVFAAAVAQVAIAAGRDDTLPVLTGVRRRDRGRRRSPWPRPTATASRSASCSGSPEQPDVSRRSPWSPRGPSPTPPSRWPPAPRSTLALAGRRHRRGPDRLRRRAAAAPPPGCSTASSPSTARCCPTEFSARRRRRRPAPFVEAVKRVALVAERNTPVRLSFCGGEVVLEAGTGDEAQAVEALARRRSRATPSTSPSTRSSCWTGSARSTPTWRACRSPRPPSPPS